MLLKRAPRVVSKPRLGVTRRWKSSGKRFESTSAASVSSTTAAPTPDVLEMQGELDASLDNKSKAARSAASKKKPALPANLDHLSDAELTELTRENKIRFFELENRLSDMTRATRIRRSCVEAITGRELTNLPYEHYDYTKVHGQCAENVVGYVPLPVGTAGPLKVDGHMYYAPLATCEGALIASTTRGCKAITESGGATTHILADGIARAPVLGVPSLARGVEVKRFVEEEFDTVAEAFNSTSRFARLQSVRAFVNGRMVFLRFRCASGDAMGMNMISKGVERALEAIGARFPDIEVLALSGNVCTDKKPSAVNWIDGRGKSVAAEAVIRGDIVRSVLKTSVEAMVRVNYAKNLVGSAVAGSVGGNNAHASNIVTAMFLATGQDPAQNVESSTCMTLLESTNDGRDLYVSVNMPSLEVGTIGGGTILPGQSACLELLGVRGTHATEPGGNARQLARIIASTVMAGELSLMAALSAGHLIKSHLALNRKPASSTADADAKSGKK